MENKIREMIIENVRDMAPSQDIEMPESLDAATPLFGEEGILDSMGLVTLVISLEESILDELDESVSLADDKAMSQANSPYKTIGSLAAYAAGQVGSSS